MSGTGELLRLHLNENVHGCSPKVIAAIRQAASRVSRYPEPPQRLEAALALKLGVDPRQVVAGAGSVRLIDGILQCFVGPEEELIFFDRSFVAYAQLAAAHHRTAHMAPLRHFACDPRDVLPLVNERTRVVLIANPNNPTGTIAGHDAVRALLHALPTHVKLVLDEAYFEFVTDPSFPDAMALLRGHPNVIVMRTFSKTHGIAGMRVGYAVAAEPVAAALRQARIPFPLSCGAEDAALAALGDEEFVMECARRNAVERGRLFDGLRALGLNAVPSQANFIYLHFESDGEKDRLFRRLLDAGILVCDLANYGQDRGLRFTVGDAAINERVLAALAR